MVLRGEGGRVTFCRKDSLISGVGGFLVWCCVTSSRPVGHSM